jgi:hypothetical protein
MVAPPVITIHGTALTAVQAQDPPVITAMLPFMPVETTETLVGETLNEQLLAPCVTVMV